MNTISKSISLLLTVLSLFSCKEEMEIDIENGEKLIGIYGSITTENIRHTVTVTRCADFYRSGTPEMIRNADVYLIDNGNDTIFYQEQKPGIYETKDILSGKEGHTYTLHVNISNDKGERQEYTAEETLLEATGPIDSIAVKPLKFNGKEIDDMFKVCPYLQSLEGKETSYLTKVAINGKMISDTLTEYSTFHLEGFAGMYINGKEMEELYDKDDFPQSVYNLNATKDDEKLQPNDLLTLYFYHISKDYSKYIEEIQNSSGSNPFFGSPSNVSSNILPKGRALGFFYAASVVTGDLRIK
ncbi:MAG: DUF4249 domain-containing protein [Prevotellaceae bacterium]|nr:DUF4249 domain-containing protein [Prevotellaceae bacterium]